MKDVMRKARTLAAGLLAVLALSPRAQAQIIGAPIYVATTGEVVATYQGHTAGYNSDLFLDAPANGLGVIFNNHASPVGSSVSLGTFMAGTELIFRLRVNSTGDVFFSGDASRNPDGLAHAAVTDNWAPGATLVGFEDILGGGDLDYDDLTFSFTNTRTVDPGAIPEPGTLALFGSAMLPLLGLRRKV